MENFEIIKFKDKDIELDVHISLVLKTAFLSLNDMSLLFERSKSAISKQLSNILKEAELDYDSVHKDSLYTALE